MTEPTLPTSADDAETIASYKRTFNLTILTVARGWADRLSARPAKASWTGAGLLALLVLGLNGWLDPMTLHSLISDR